VGLLVIGPWASARTPAPRPCCSRCERCVSSVCPDPPAKTPLKPALAGPGEVAAPLLVLDRPQPSRLAAGAQPAIRFVLPGFDPPMRN